MKIRKIIIIFTLLLSSFILMACGSSNRSYDLNTKLPKDYLNANARVINPYKDTFTKMEKLNDYERIQNFLQGEFLVTSKLVDGVFDYGLHDIFANKLVLETKYRLIENLGVYHYNNLLNKNVYANYFRVTDKNGRLGIFSAKDNMWIVNLDSYELLNLQTQTLNSQSIETITSKLVDEKLKETKNLITFDEDGNLTRSLLDGFNKGDTLFENYGFTRYVNDVRLKPFKYEFITPKLLIGYKNDKQIFKVNLPHEETEFRFIVGKYMFFQTKVNLPFDSKNYTFFDGVNKVLLNTYKLDLTTGKLKEMKNFNYILSNTSQRFDAKGVPSYFVANAVKIDNKTVLTNQSLLFDTNLTAIELSGTITNLGDNRYLVGNRIVDEKNNVLLRMFYDNIAYLANVNLISMTLNGKYGLVNHLGEIVAPFEFNQPFNFFNGFSYNTLSGSNEAVLVSKEGAVSKLAEGDSYYTNGFLYKINGTTLVIKNYQNQTLLSLDGNYDISNFIQMNSLNDSMDRAYYVIIRNVDTNELSYYIVK